MEGKFRARSERIGQEAIEAREKLREETEAREREEKEKKILQDANATASGGSKKL